MKFDVAARPAVTAPAPPATSFGSFRLLQVLILGLTIAGVVIGLRISVPGGVAPVNAVAFGLTVVWALVGFVDTHARDRTGSKVSPFHLIAAVDAFVAMIALTMGRQAETVHTSTGAHDVATVAAVAVTAISFHFLLALPDGRLHDSFRRTTVRHRLPRRARCGDRAEHQPPALHGRGQRHQLGHRRGVGDRTLRVRYIASIGYLRDRMEWFGIGVTLAATVALVATVLHLLVGWPGPLGAGRGGSHGARSHSGSSPARARGWTARKPGVGPGPGGVRVRRGGVGDLSRRRARARHAPKTTGDKEALALAMVASGVAALIFVPVRTVVESATRLVYGSREAPDEVLRTFGSRLTRAIPMDELLLQLAESSARPSSLTSAEVYTGTGEVLERTASVPDLGPASLVVSARERPVVTRAGVSGTAWASVWLPALLQGRESGRSASRRSAMPASCWG